MSETISEEQSVLATIKKLLNVADSATEFDTDIKVLINSTMPTLAQLGYAPSETFRVTSRDDTWVQLLGAEADNPDIKELIWLKVRLVFDPPQNGFLVTSLKEVIAEKEWRLKVAHDKT